MKTEQYDDMLPVSLHQASTGEYHLLDRHNDEIATFDKAIELDDMQRIVNSINTEGKFALFLQGDAFITGAKWWEHHKTGATMWQSDQALVEEAAKKIYRIPSKEEIEQHKIKAEDTPS